MQATIYGGFYVRLRIAENTADQIMLKSIAGLSLLNPRKYTDLYNSSQMAGPTQFRLKGEDYLYLNGIIVTSDMPLLISDMDKRKQLADLFRYIRSASLQYDLNFKADGIIYQESDVKPSQKSGLSDLDEIGMPENIYSTYLDWKELEAIDQKMANKVRQPIYKEIVLDAIEAHFTNDFTKSILYFSMACEIGVSYKLEMKYQELKESNSLLREMKDTQTNAVLDPVFEVLNQQREMKNKIHQAYLYLFNKSLLIEKKSLYDAVIKLYKTRNSIVHFGEIKDGGDKSVLSLDAQGSEKAFDIAISFFDWLEDSSLNIFKERKMKMFQ